MKTLQERAKSDAKRKIWEGRVNKKLLLKLFNLQKTVYPYVYGKLNIKENIEEFGEIILNEDLFGVLRSDRPIEVISYYNLLKRELVVLLKSPNIHPTNFEMVKILACLDILCRNTKELKTKLRPYSKNSRLHTYINVLEEYNENAYLLSEFVVKYGQINNCDALVTKVLQFVKDFEASEE